MKSGGVVLSAENERKFFIPRGFAHGFLVLSDTAEFCCKCDDIYHSNDEGASCGTTPPSASAGLRSRATPHSTPPRSS